MELVTRLLRAGIERGNIDIVDNDDNGINFPGDDFSVVITTANAMVAATGAATYAELKEMKTK